MTLEGTVVNGVIVLDSGAQLPEGARVHVEVEDAEDIGPPPEPYDREMELAILCEAMEDVRAGRGIPFEEFMSEIAAEFKLPPVPPEPHDREKELSILREALEDVRAGRGTPAREFLKSLAVELDLPLEPDE